MNENDWMDRAVKGALERIEAQKMNEEPKVVEVNVYMPESENFSVPEGAVIFAPDGTELSDEALETINHMHYYLNGNKGFVLLSNRTGIIVEAASVGDMGDEALRTAEEVCGSMPDFTPYPMDDGCTLVTMQGNAVAFCPRSLFVGDQLAHIGAAIAMRNELIHFCGNFNVRALVYNDMNDAQLYN